MAVLKCKMCGGDLVLTPGDSICVCEFCGTQQTVPNIDDDKKLALFTRANKLRYSCDFDKAYGVYGSIVVDFPEEAEAYWGLVLCKYGIEYVDDPATGKKIPTCHRSSFESIFDDPNFEQALENADSAARAVYRNEAKAIEELRKGIVEISSKEAPYDIFICYKETDGYGDRTVDSLIAQDVYEELTKKGYRVFFSRISLEDKLGQEYEPYIFAALSSAKIMLAFGTDYEYYNAVWVKNEWSRFLHLIAKGEQKYLIPCYKNLDVYDMPKEFAKLQAQDMGKVGAMQDLLRGIEKLLPKEAAKPVYVNMGDTADRLRKVEIHLQEQKWKSVQDGCNAIVDVDPECAMAYVYQLARINRITKLADFEQCINILSNSSFYEKALKYADPELASQLKHWCRCSEENYKKVTQLCAPARERAKKLDGILSGGKAHTVGLKTDGTVISCGSNEKGQRNVGSWRDIVYIACGDYHTVGLKSDGTVVACGDNENGQCDVGSWKNIVHISCDACHTVGICADGTVVACGSKENDRCNVSQWTDIVSGACGYRHTVVQDKNGNMFAVGANGKKQCAVGDWENIVGFCANNLFTVGLKENGTVISCGDSDAGALDVKQWRNIVAISCGTHHTAGLLADGTVIACGSDKSSRCSSTKDWHNVVAVSCAAWHTMGIRADGTIVHCGDSDDNKRDLDNWKLFESIDTLDEERATATEARKAKDAQAAERRKKTTQTQKHINALLSGGEEFSIAVLSDMTTISCGSNELNKRLVRGLDCVLSVSCGKDFTVALVYDGEKQSLYGFGNNEQGQYNMPDISEKRVRSVACGYQHTAFLFADGTVYATGENGDGRCDVSQWHDIVDIACGWDYTVGLRADGTVVSCGRNDNGQRNVENWNNIIMIDVRNGHTVGLCADGSVVACGLNNHGQCNVSDWTDMIAISCGSHHTVGLRADGTVVACGLDTNGRCTNTNKWNDIVGIKCTYWLTMGVKRDGTIVACGDNEQGQRNLNGFKIFESVEAFDVRWSHLNKCALDTGISDKSIVAEIPRAQREKIITGARAIGTNDHTDVWPSGRPKTVFNYDKDHVIAFNMDASQSKLANKSTINLGVVIFDPDGAIVMNSEEALTWASNYDRVAKTYSIRRKDGSVAKTGKYRAAFWIDNSEKYMFEFTVTSDAEVEKRQREQMQILEKLKSERRIIGVCQHCGGNFKGFLLQRCAFCGRSKDY